MITEHELWNLVRELKAGAAMEVFVADDVREHVEAGELIDPDVVTDFRSARVYRPTRADPADPARREEHLITRQHARQLHEAGAYVLGQL